MTPASADPGPLDPRPLDPDPLDPGPLDPRPLDPGPLDAGDPLAALRSRFTPAPGVVSYLDGNSLGRPVAGTAEAMARFVTQDWGGRLIRGWTEGWLDRPVELGDRLAAVALGAAPGQVVIADSTTVLLYKLARAAVAARPDRREIVAHADDFPTDRYVVEGVAAERGLRVRWIVTDPDAGLAPEEVAAAVGPQTALVCLSHVAYRSGRIVDAAAVTAAVHAAGALVLWDLSHSAGAVPVELDAWGADLAVGCTYKYLCGGPGSPAFAYVRRDLQDGLHQPVQGWIGRRDPFAMEPGYLPAEGIRSVLSGTPPVLAMLPLESGLALLAQAGVDAVRAKSRALTGYVLDLADAWLVPRGVRIGSPRAAALRGGHVMLRHPDAAALVDRLQARGVIPDHRVPDGIRIGPAPLSTSFAEVHTGLAVLRDLLDAR